MQCQGAEPCLHGSPADERPGAGTVPQPADAGRRRDLGLPFTTYRVPADTNWALAYYKLCAMAWVLENRDFARAAMLDLDTFTQRPLDDLWRECDEAVLLYQVPHAASQTMTAAISHCFDAVEPNGAPHALTHFGGELVAGNRARLTDFMSLCRDYFEELQAKGITPGRVTRPSGAVPPTAVCWPVNPVRAANAYIFRYWLGGHFYYVSTNYTLRPRLRAAPARGSENAPADGALPQICQAGASPLENQTACGGLPAAAIRRCCAACGCGCGPKSALNPPMSPKRKNDAGEKTYSPETSAPPGAPNRPQNPDDLGPMMRAIKAVHSISDHTSTTPEDLERQRAAQELFARLVTPGIGIRTTASPSTMSPPRWVSLEHGP